MELQHEIKTVFLVDYNDLDSFISQEYGYQFESIADQEWSNYMSREFTVEKKPFDINDTLDKYDIEELEEYIKTGEGNFILQILLRDLCVRNRIKPGHYVINISW